MLVRSMTAGAAMFVTMSVSDTAFAASDWPDTPSCELLRAAVDTGEVGSMEEASFVLGNTLFTIFHEIGHALTDILQLPVVGREEDAVDALASLLMLPEDPDVCSDSMIIDAADGWLFSAMRAEAEDEPVDFFDEHGLDEQRFAATACLITGSDPEGFADYAADLDMDEDRIDYCAENFDNTAFGWLTLLDEIIREDTNATANGIIDVSIEQATGYAAPMEPLMRGSGIVDFALETFASNFNAPEELSLIIQSCDDINAWYDPGTKQVTICYELVSEFRDLFGTMSE